MRGTLLAQCDPREAVPAHEFLILEFLAFGIPHVNPSGLRIGNDQQGKRQRDTHAHYTSRPRLRKIEPYRGGGREQNGDRSEEHTSELQSRLHLVCRLLLEKKKH